METVSLNKLPALSKAKLKLMNSLALKKYRRREGRFVAEGVRLVEEARSAGVGISWVVVAEQGEGNPLGDRVQDLLSGLLESGVPVYRTGKKDLCKALDPVQPQPVAAVCELVSSRLENWQVPERAVVVVCDALKEPGNLGAVIRAAAASGTDAVLVGPDTVDPFNSKCVRASAGSLFRLPVFEASSSAVTGGFLEDNGFAVFEAATEGENLFAVEFFPERTALILGSEAEGISTTFTRLGRRSLAVPMADGVESLNVAVAAGIILYEIGRRSGRF